MSADLSELRPGAIVKGPVLPEPIEVLVVRPFAGMVKVIGKPGDDVVLGLNDRVER